MNNPINSIDINGDTVIYSDYTLDHSGIGRTQALINQGLGLTNAASIATGGALTLNVSPEQLANMTDEQKGFYDVVSAVNNDSRGNVSIAITGWSSTLIGEYNSREIDIKRYGSCWNRSGC